MSVKSMAQILGPHHVTRGMSVTMGRTCACGFWEHRNLPVYSGSDGLDTHRAEVLAAAGYGAVEPYEDLLASIWLYIAWNYVTKELTTKDKDLFADSIDAAHIRADGEMTEDTDFVERWWKE